MNASLNGEEVQANKNMQFWDKIENGILRRKARATRIKQGDANNSYVHACLKNRIA